MGTKIWLDAQAWALRRVERLGRRSTRAAHLTTGIHGEREALFYLRKMGYTVVAQRWRSTKLRGDLDLVAWEGEWLCFVEVKTRTRKDPMAPAESAVDEGKRKMIRRMARAYLTGFPRQLRDEVPVRFDVVSVYLQASGVEFDLYRGSFGWR